MKGMVIFGVSTCTFMSTKPQFQEMLRNEIISATSKEMSKIYYLGTKMELWRKFSKTFRYSASSFSACFSASVLGQAQQGPFSPPQPSGLVGSVASSVSMVPSAYLRIGTLSWKKRTELVSFLSRSRIQQQSMFTHSLYLLLFSSCQWTALAGRVPDISTPEHFSSPTFGAIVVSVQVTVLRLLLPAHDVVGEVPIGKRGRIPFHNQLGWGVGCWNNIQGNGWH